MYYYGIGAPANKPLGTAWIRRSAEQGYNPAIIASTQINVCNSSVTPKKVKKCLDTSRDITPFDDQSYPSQSSLEDTSHKVALLPNLDAEIVPSETATVAEIIATVPVIEAPAIVLADELNTALQTTGANEPFIKLSMLENVAQAAPSIEQKNGWVVQIATFKNVKNAQALVTN